MCSGARGVPHEKRLWACAGYAHLVMDSRGQGADTSDPDVATGGVAAPGFLTRGVLDPERYYYRRLYTDAVRAVAAVRAHPAVDPARVAVTGTSQGGGIALAVAGLAPGLRAVLPDVPFLCCFPRAATLTDQPPYVEITRYVKLHRAHAETVMRTLSYFDAAVLAPGAARRPPGAAPRAPRPDGRGHHAYGARLDRGGGGRGRHGRRTHPRRPRRRPHVFVRPDLLTQAAAL
ncbi:acetylxylan esterase [Nonomuraea sp. NPDC048882]|uniref:acetylxylan esterase n=1 Tax=Nonomuraea sp. NPDC048882 TaxID=3154347 RepID=UPI00340A7063